MSEDKGKGLETDPATPIASKPPATIVLPLTFTNSFWSSDYRTGADTLYGQLEAGIVQSQEFVGLVRQRASAERKYAASIEPFAPLPGGFGNGVGGSLALGYEALLDTSLFEAQVRDQLANDLEKEVANPFELWSFDHKARVSNSRAIVESSLSLYEKKHAEVLKLRTSYAESCRQLDLVEDQINFSGNSQFKTRPLISLHARTNSELSTSSSRRPHSPSVSSSAGDFDDFEDTKIGGSLTSAFGRAISVRVRQATRTNSNSTMTSDSNENPVPDVSAAVDWGKGRFNQLYEKVAGPQTIDGRYARALREAETAEDRYKEGVELLDTLRLNLEETLSTHYVYAGTWETTRIKNTTAAFKSFNMFLSELPQKLASATQRCNMAILSVRPESQVQAIIEQLRTGPFQPNPTTFQSHYSEPVSYNFGLDLRKWEETNKTSHKVPPILTFLLDCCTKKYGNMSDDDRRKAWFLETPLAAQHHLRSALNYVTDSTLFDGNLVARYDLPIIVSTIKLWLLELDVPVILHAHYDQYKALYPRRVGTEDNHPSPAAVGELLTRLPSAHLEVLRAVIGHLYELVSTTKTEESDDLYLQKLSISSSRCLLRPANDTPLTLNDKFPNLLLADLVSAYEDIFKSTDSLREKKSEERLKPRRQRTQLVDNRISRSRIGHKSMAPSEKLEMMKELQSPPPSASTSGPALKVNTHLSPSPSQNEFSGSPLDMTPTLTSPRVQPPGEMKEETEDLDEEEIAKARLSPDSAPKSSEPMDDETPQGSSLTSSSSLRQGRRGVRGPRPMGSTPAESADTSD